jgi:hypothetical protein
MNEQVIHPCRWNNMFTWCKVAIDWLGLAAAASAIQTNAAAAVCPITANETLLLPEQKIYLFGRVSRAVQQQWPT